MMNTTIQTKPKKFRSVKATKTTSTIISYITLVILSIIWLYPIVWILLNSLRVEYNNAGQLIGIVVSHYIPKSFGFENFVRLFNETLFPRWFLNTLMVSSVSFVLSMVVHPAKIVSIRNVFKMIRKNSCMIYPPMIIISLDLK